MNYYIEKETVRRALGYAPLTSPDKPFHISVTTLPMPCAPAMIPTARMAARSPYSMAVAPLSFLTNFEQPQLKFLNLLIMFTPNFLVALLYVAVTLLSTPSHISVTIIAIPLMPTISPTASIATKITYSIAVAPLWSRKKAAHIFWHLFHMLFYKSLPAHQPVLYFSCQRNVRRHQIERTNTIRKNPAHLLTLFRTDNSVPLPTEI